MKKELELLFDVQDKVTLKDLAKTGHTFWRFSQSEPGRSVEPHFEQYVPGVISTAKDSVKKLSFVDEEHIGVCIPYGDMLTKLNFDLNDKSFQEIENCEVKRIGNFFEEYECEKLLPKENYSLEELSTLKMLIQMTKCHEYFVRMCIASTSKGELWQVLKSYGFAHSSNVMKQIRSAVERKPHFTQGEAIEIIDKYIKQYLKDESYTEN